MMPGLKGLSENEEHERYDRETPWPATKTQGTSDFARLDHAKNGL